MKFKSLLVIGISLATLGLSSAAGAKQTQPAANGNGLSVSNINRTGFVDRINGNSVEDRFIARIKDVGLDSVSIGCKGFQDKYDEGMKEVRENPAGSDAAAAGQAKANSAKSSWDAICTSFGDISFRTVKGVKVKATDYSGNATTQVK